MENFRCRLGSKCLPLLRPVSLGILVCYQLPMRVDGYPSTLSVTLHLGTAQGSWAEIPEGWPPSQSRRHLLETQWPGLVGGVLICSGYRGRDHRLGGFNKRNGFSQFWVPEMRHQCVGRAMLPAEALGKDASCLFLVPGGCPQSAAFLAV